MSENRKSIFIANESVISAKDMSVDINRYRWKVFLAGPSGSGKTQSLITLPGKNLLVDCDNRAETLAGVENIDIYPCHEVDPRAPKAWDKLERLRKVIIYEIGAGIFPYTGVCFDGLTSMGRVCMNWALTLDPGRGLGGSAARQHYGPQMDNLAKFVLSILALPINIVFTGHIELLEDDETGGHKFFPKIVGKLRTEVSNWFNETYYCYRARDTKENKLRYYWQTAGSGKQEFFKSSLNNLNKYWSDPIELNFSADGPHGFEDLWQRRFGKEEVKRNE